MPVASSGNLISSTAQIVDRTITAADIAADTITANEIAANAVGDSEIAAHTTTKITVPFSKVTGTVPLNQGGTGQTTQGPAFDALAPTTTRGDIIYRGASANLALPAGSSGQVLTANGAAADPSWQTPSISTASFAASANTRNSNDTQKTTSAGAFTKLKEIKINAAIAGLRVYFEIENEINNGSTTHGRVYVNGVATGADHGNNTASFVSYTDDLTNLVANDLVQIYVYNSASTACDVRNMRLQYDKTITAIAGDTLSTPLATTAAISVTNQDP